MQGWIAEPEWKTKRIDMVIEGSLGGAWLIWRRCPDALVRYGG